MNAFAHDAWHDFFVAEVGASAALAGLVIVTVSINTATILKSPTLPGRAAETITLFAGVLLLSTLMLVPGQPPEVMALELFLVGALVLGVTLFIQVRAWPRRHPDEQFWLRLLFSLGAALPLLLAGGSFVVGAGGGLYWLVPAVASALIGGIVNTWILLVEILR